MARKLYLLLGVPGIGKSSWIKQYGLESFTISLDRVRQLYSNNIAAVIPNIVKVYGGDKVVNKVVDKEQLSEANINYKNNRNVKKIVNQLVTHRMQNGETTIIDSTHLSRESFDKYKAIANKYNYEIVIIDFMKGVEDDGQDPLDTAIARNSQRFYSIEEDIIRKYFKRYKVFIKDIEPHLHIKVITPEQFILDIQPKNITNQMNKFDTIKIIGDINGNFDVLKSVFENHHKGTAYVFTGNYFGDGKQNSLVLDFLLSLKGKNIFFLRGSKEQDAELFAYKSIVHGKHNRVILNDFLQHYKFSVLKNKLNELASRLNNYLYFKAFGQDYLITHAGLDYVRLNLDNGNFYTVADLMNQNEFTLGLSNYGKSPYDRNVDKDYFEHFDDTVGYVIQIHGHRNKFHVGQRDYEVSYNLKEDSKFRWLTITKQGIETYEINA